jgi:hypothetical protein
MIEDIITDSTAVTPNDTVTKELHEIAERENGSFVLALYLLGFGTYHGFESLTRRGEITLP